jgi:hypothetical protein
LLEFGTSSFGVPAAGADALSNVHQVTLTFLVAVAVRTWLRALALAAPTRRARHERAKSKNARRAKVSRELLFRKSIAWMKKVEECIGVQV